MQISSWMSDRRYGGYHIADYEIEVDVPNARGEMDALRNHASVRITFRFTDETSQSGGDVELSSEAARWLGIALIEAGTGELASGGKKAIMKGDRPVAVAGGPKR